MLGGTEGLCSSLSEESQALFPSASWSKEFEGGRDRGVLPMFGQSEDLSSLELPKRFFSGHELECLVCPKSNWAEK